jgi:hypothetical protein
MMVPRNTVESLRSTLCGSSRRHNSVLVIQSCRADGANVETLFWVRRLGGLVTLGVQQEALLRTQNDVAHQLQRPLSCGVYL